MADRSTVLNNKLNHNHSPKKKKEKSRKKKKSQRKSKKAEKHFLKKVSTKSNDVNLNRATTDVNHNPFPEQSTFSNSIENKYQHTDDKTIEISSNQRNTHLWSPSSNGANQVSHNKFENNFARCTVFEQNAYHTDYFPNNMPYRNFRSSESSSSLLDKVEYLTRENIMLHNKLNELNYSWNETIDSKIDLVFRNEDLKVRFHDVLRSLISNLLNGIITVQQLKEFCLSLESQNKEKTPEPDFLFSVDCSSDPVVNKNTPVPVPRYNTSFHEILETPDETKGSPAVKSNRIAQECFNCGQDHNLSNCPQVLNYRKIAAARRGRKRQFVSSLRYHVHGKNEKDFKPGVISDQLRVALDLEEKQIPEYIYRMRVLDYPPGWLAEAEVESSGITLYGSDGNVEEDENEDVNNPMVKKVQYDPDKLVEYPGFNVPLPPDVFDDAHHLELPPLQEHQLKCYITQGMEKPDTCPNKKRKLMFPDDKPHKSQRCEEDMEIEVIESDNSNEFVSEFVPPLPDYPPSTPEYIPPPPPPDFDYDPPKNSPQTPTYNSPNDAFNSPPCVFTDGSESPAHMSHLLRSNNPDPPLYTPASPSYAPISPSYIPTSPLYTRGSPTYNPISPPSYSPVSPTYNPISPSNIEPPPPAEETEVSNFSLVSQSGPDSPLESNLAVGDLLRVKSFDFDSGTSSPSLAELLKLKNQIKQELGIPLEENPSSGGSVNEESCPVVDLTEDKNSEEDYITEDEFIASEHSNEALNISGSSNSLPEEPCTLPDSPEPMQKTLSKSKLVTLGTPSLSRHSSFNKLPDYDKFSKNVSPHMPFENLPSSTGAYTKLKNVLKNVKDKYKNIFRQ